MAGYYFFVLIAGIKTHSPHFSNYMPFPIGFDQGCRSFSDRRFGSMRGF